MHQILLNLASVELFLLRLLLYWIRQIRIIAAHQCRYSNTSSSLSRRTGEAAEPISLVNTPQSIGAPSVLGPVIMWVCYSCACTDSVTYETQNLNGTLRRESPYQSSCKAGAPINLKRPYCPHESPSQGESCDILAGLGHLDAGSSQSVMINSHNGCQWSTDRSWSSVLMTVSHWVKISKSSLTLNSCVSLKWNGRFCQWKMRCTRKLYKWASGWAFVAVSPYSIILNSLSDNWTPTNWTALTIASVCYHHQENPMST